MMWSDQTTVFNGEMMIAVLLQLRARSERVTVISIMNELRRARGSAALQQSYGGT